MVHFSIEIYIYFDILSAGCAGYADNLIYSISFNPPYFMK